MEVDDGAGGDFHPLTGVENTDAHHYLALSFTVYDGIVEGVTYRFRYRSLNDVGWSDYSPISFIRAASIPSKPPAPQLDAVTSSSITLRLSPAAEDGGSPITSHKILRDDGDGFTANAYAFELTRYDGSSSTFEATVADDSLELGKIYRFSYVATNAYGDSEFSNHLIAGVGDPPVVASAPTRDDLYDLFDLGSQQVQMMIRWDKDGVTSSLQVLGFQLWMDDGLANDDRYSLIFDSGTNPLADHFLVTNLTQSLTYRF